jgi:hypothetical protein
VSARNQPRIDTCKKHSTTHLRAGGVCPLCERIGRAKLSVVASPPETIPQVEGETMSEFLTTGQLSLSDEIFVRLESPAVHLSVGGTAKLLMDEWAALGGGLEPKDAVALTCLCTVSKVGTDGDAVIIGLHLETISGLQVMAARDE